ncbi:MAG: carboxyl transferase, partial [Deltaproteobacteria bacterium]|nr:carboxyl transferase [Deltaproteobacteria bacterium]
MKFQEVLEEFAQKKEKALGQGGPEKIKKQHDRGALTARERVAKILDEDSFMEWGLFATSDRPGMEDKTPADGVVLGYGTINNRRVGVVANDFTVLASTNARINLKKSIQ